MTKSGMKLVVTGAGGRMGQTLIRLIAGMEGVQLHAAIERAGSPLIGRDAGEMAGAGTLGVAVTSDPLAAFLNAEGVIDFTSPASTVEFAGLAAQARIVHVVGTTGCSAADDEKIKAAARHARIVKSGNMSLGVNLLAELVRQAARSLDAAGWDIEVLEMHHKHKVDAPSGTALLLGEAAAEGRGIDLGERSVRVRDGHTGPREEGSIGFAGGFSDSVQRRFQLLVVTVLDFFHIFHHPHARRTAVVDRINDRKHHADFFIHIIQRMITSRKQPDI